ncbi:transcription elongation factor Elf1 [Enterococcus sp. PF1-24]|uniref:hypothetical protein n=1 Tax=unclassified Enterococcus TaxID=2608891 RepID=UPI002475275E|nr:MULTISPECIES: hypothetical protein [unclassified Enterococcus]MDH6365018.1 transcription elongation factor Elf1 [Enterococcus sp. PFB1-1]MDH6402119.1 transcription elongation factor Elf1 [Enterococcus sp. PF1-24]
MKEFKCPNCGAKLKSMQVNKTFKGREIIECEFCLSQFELELKAENQTRDNSAAKASKKMMQDIKNKVAESNLEKLEREYEEELRIAEEEERAKQLAIEEQAKLNTQVQLIIGGFIGIILFLLIVF